MDLESWQIGAYSSLYELAVLTELKLLTQFGENIRRSVGAQRKVPDERARSEGHA